MSTDKTLASNDAGGRLPITSEDGSYYIAACAAIISLSRGRRPEPDDLQHISEAKGMFGRLFILGQRDRIAVGEALGSPSTKDAKRCHSWLQTLRNTIKRDGDAEALFADPVAHVALEALDRAQEALLKGGYKMSAEPFRP